MTLRSTATTALASRLATVYSTRVAIGRMLSSESDGDYAVLIPGDENPESGDPSPLGPVRIKYSIAVWKNVKNSGLSEWDLIGNIISDTRATIELSEPYNFEIIYAGATPFYSEDGGPLIGAEMRYIVQNFIG
jgi:hypothetical protein